MAKRKKRLCHSCGQHYKYLKPCDNCGLPVCSTCRIAFTFDVHRPLEDTCFVCGWSDILEPLAAKYIERQMTGREDHYYPTHIADFTHFVQNIADVRKLNTAQLLKELWFCREFKRLPEEEMHPNSHVAAYVLYERQQRLQQKYAKRLPQRG